MAALTTTIFIARGTIVFEHRNGANGIEERAITLASDCYVEASRLDDGRWGYVIANRVYSCAGGFGTEMVRQDHDGWITAAKHLAALSA